MDWLIEAGKGIFGFATFCSWAYASTGLIACQTAGIPYPNWWYTAAAVAVVTFFGLLCCLVYDLLVKEMPRHKSRRARRRQRGCLGVIRYMGNGCWAAVRENDNEREDV